MIVGVLREDKKASGIKQAIRVSLNSSLKVVLISKLKILGSFGIK